MTQINKILVANRGEIAIRIFRACTELGIKTVSIFAFEDRFSLHRYKADESFQVGKNDSAVAAYLNIEDIVRVAKEAGCDAIHPGYGFLSERQEFAEAIRAAGMEFIGPSSETLRVAGDKVLSRELAEELDIPVIPGTSDIENLADAEKKAETIGYPIIIKSAFGGGGRGMRVVREASELRGELSEASKEAGLAFGKDDVFIEKYLENPRHIEVQLIGDGSGKVSHLYDRDCSIQRRHQKVVELAPADHLDPKLREQLFSYAVSLGEKLKLKSVSTAEFLVSNSGEIYFIEINPRIQVEHTVTEEVTGIDIVQSQILLASNNSLDDLNLSQEAIKTSGAAVQCRITTEDPENNFQADYGQLVTYRSASGHGIRLDAGSAYTGAEVLPYYDSMLVKLTAHGRDIRAASAKLARALLEFRVRGVKTNIPFLQNIVADKDFLELNLNTGFIGAKPELFDFPVRRNRANKILSFLADVSVNGHELMPALKERPRPEYKGPVETPLANGDIPPGWRDILTKEGKEVFLEKLKEEKPLLLTDTTLRDAHQSLLATRVRTYDMLQIAPAIARSSAKLFSLEMWGGATFDVAWRFLQESPWDRLAQLREEIPNIPFQMLLRGTNAVGYSSYPDNVITEFIKESHSQGIDIFRIFDCLNSLEKMRLSIDTVAKEGGVAEVCICYTSDLLQEDAKGKTGKFNSEYYSSLAKSISDAGADIIAIKDMAGLLRAPSATRLIDLIRDVCDLPIHLHSHDTAGGQLATYLSASQQGVDIVDTALSALSGVTSQPSLEGLVAMLEGDERETGIELEKQVELSSYWDKTRKYYSCFESDLKTSTSEVYQNEIPGGQYSNLRPQAESLGLGSKLDLVKQSYEQVNDLFGGIVKVTPSSKVVGDLAMYMVANELSIEDIKNQASSLTFPDSVVGFLKGDLGIPFGGFPEKFRNDVLGENFKEAEVDALPAADFEAAKSELKDIGVSAPSKSDILSYLLYPRVLKTWFEKNIEFGDVSKIPSPAFFQGVVEGEEIAVELEAGKIIYIKLLAIGECDEHGERAVFFELNGMARTIKIQDQASGIEVEVFEKADKDNPNHVGAPLAGALIEIAVKPGDSVKAGDSLFTLEAMKMQTQVTATKDGEVSEVLRRTGDKLSGGDLVLTVV